MRATRSCPTCGYTWTYRSPAVADAQHSRHDCDYQRRRVAAATRRAARVARAGELTRDCLHSGRPHQHGSRLAYIKDRCRCPRCVAANTAHWRHTYRSRLLGRGGGDAPAAPIRQHVARLRAAGIGYQQIARLAGTSVTHIREIDRAVARSGDRPPIRRIRRELAERLLTLDPHPINRAPHSHVDATGTRRRLHALIAAGWPERALAEKLHRPVGNLRRLLYARQVTARTARAVADCYRRLENTAPPAEQAAIAAAKVLAAEHGWPPPAAWDDIDTDPDPAPPRQRRRGEPAGIDEIAVDRAVAGDGVHLADLTPAEQTEAVRRLTARGKSIRQIAEQLATTPSAVSRRRARTAA